MSLQLHEQSCENCKSFPTQKFCHIWYIITHSDVVLNMTVMMTHDSGVEHVDVVPETYGGQNESSFRDGETATTWQWAMLKSTIGMSYICGNFRGSYRRQPGKEFCNIIFEYPSLILRMKISCRVSY